MVYNKQQSKQIHKKTIMVRMTAIGKSANESLISTFRLMCISPKEISSGKLGVIKTFNYEINGDENGCVCLFNTIETLCKKEDVYYNKDHLHIIVMDKI